MAETPRTLTAYPGVRMGFVGVLCLVGAIVWSVVQPASDVPFGGAEILALVGGILVLTAFWRGGLAALKEDGAS